MTTTKGDMSRDDVTAIVDAFDHLADHLRSTYGVDEMSMTFRRGDGRLLTLRYHPETWDDPYGEPGSAKDERGGG